METTLSKIKNFSVSEIELGKTMIDIIYACKNTINTYFKVVGFDDEEAVLEDFVSVLKWIHENGVKDFTFKYHDCCDGDYSDSFVLTEFKDKCTGEIEDYSEVSSMIYDVDMEVEDDNEARCVNAYNENTFISGSDCTWYIVFNKK